MIRHVDHLPHTIDDLPFDAERKKMKLMSLFVVPLVPLSAPCNSFTVQSVLTVIKLTIDRIDFWLVSEAQEMF